MCYTLKHFPLRVLVFIFLILPPLKAVSEQNIKPIASKPLLNIGVSFAIPPWVISETDSGVELDILKQALAHSGYDVKPNYLSFALAYSLFESGKLDGVINAKESALKSGYLSDPVVTFQNVAISLKKNNYPENISISFLQDKSVVAFQKASIFLGDEFRQMAQENPMYQEVAKQSLQINLLMIRNIDFIIMDKSIFGYYWNQAQSDPNLIRAKAKLNQAVRFHYLFDKNNYRFVFKSEQVKDDFNRGLAKLKEDGDYDKIFRKYEHLNNLYPDS